MVSRRSVDSKWVTVVAAGAGVVTGEEFEELVAEGVNLVVETAAAGVGMRWGAALME
jgi:hypothetical protein